MPRAVALGLETLLWLRRQPAVGLVTFIALTELNSTRPNPSQHRFFSFLYSPGFCLDLACFAFSRRSVAGTPERSQSKLITPAGRPRPPEFYSSLSSSSSVPTSFKPIRPRRNCDRLCRREPCHRPRTPFNNTLANHLAGSGAYCWCYFPGAGLCTVLLFRCSVFFCITTTFTRVRDTLLPQPSWCLLSVHLRRRLVRARS